MKLTMWQQKLLNFVKLSVRTIHDVLIGPILPSIANHVSWNLLKEWNSIMLQYYIWHNERNIYCSATLSFLHALSVWLSRAPRDGSSLFFLDRVKPEPIFFGSGRAWATDFASRANASPKKFCSSLLRASKIPMKVEIC